MGMIDKVFFSFLTTKQSISENATCWELVGRNIREIITKTATNHYFIILSFLILFLPVTIKFSGYYLSIFLVLLSFLFCF